MVQFGAAQYNVVVSTVRSVDDMGIRREGFASIQSAPRDDRLGYP